jgi:hypothetical protein
MIVLEPSNWENNIKKRLIQDYGPRIMISYVCRRELGFTVRVHKGWIDNPQYRTELAQYKEKERLYMESAQSGKINKHTIDDVSVDWLLSGEPARGHSVHQICLDFYNCAQETYFRLKYL